MAKRVSRHFEKKLRVLFFISVSFCSLNLVTLKSQTHSGNFITYPGGRGQTAAGGRGQTAAPSRDPTRVTRWAGVRASATELGNLTSQRARENSSDIVKIL